MPNTYTAVTKQDGDYWIGWIEEVPGVNCQESTHEQLMSSLRETLAEALEMNRNDVIGFAVSNYSENWSWHETQCFDQASQSATM